MGLLMNQLLIFRDVIPFTNDTALYVLLGFLFVELFVLYHTYIGVRQGTIVMRKQWVPRSWSHFTEMLKADYANVKALMSSIYDSIKGVLFALFAFYILSCMAIAGFMVFGVFSLFNPWMWIGLASMKYVFTQ